MTNSEGSREKRGSLLFFETQSPTSSGERGGCREAGLRDSQATDISILNANDFWTKSFAVATGLPFANLTRTRSFGYLQSQQSPEGMEPLAVKVTPQTRVLGL